MTNKIQDFHVGMKAFIMDGERLLMVKGNHIDPHWELPGGRIDVGEELVPAKEILQREVAEELGGNLQVEIRKPVSTWSRQLANVNKFVYLIGFDCRYITGEIHLSHEHTEYKWVTESESRGLDLAAGYDRALDSFWKNR